MNPDLLTFADDLDSMTIGATMHAADIEITRTGDDTYRVDPAFNGRALLCMIEVVDYVSEVAR